MKAHGNRRWVAPAMLLSAVALIGAGVIGILRVSLTAKASWLAVILPVVGVVGGTALLFIPLFRRLAREASEDEAER